MESETTKQHQDESSNNITCGIITLSDSRDKKEDLSGDYIENELKKMFASNVEREHQQNQSQFMDFGMGPATPNFNNGYLQNGIVIW